MTFEHACFLSFPRDAGNASTFAQALYCELKKHLDVYGKNQFRIFKYDQCEERRQGDDWALWIQRELCQSAMMVAVCAPTYFNGSAGCVSEFDGMELLAQRRGALLTSAAEHNWIVGLRLKDTVPLPRLNKNYHVVDFFDCCASPRRIKEVRHNRDLVEKLADRIYAHWQWVNQHPLRAQLQQADICATFALPSGAVTAADAFPHGEGVR